MLLGLLVNGVGALGGEGRLFISVSKHLKASGPAPAPQDLHGPRLELHVVIHLSIPSEDNPVESVVTCIYYKWECDRRCSVDEQKCHR